ncbi:ubiquinone-dependent pyruvate dehydrogenase, partial [Paraburkholderia sp. SIMBA_054]
LLGCDFPYRPFYPAHAKIIQGDGKGSRLGRRGPLALGLVGTVKETVAATLPRLQRKTDRGFIDNARRHYASARKDLDDLA